MNRFELIYLATDDELARAVASAWLAGVAAANHAGKPHSVALSGGRISRKFFAAVVELSRMQGVSLAGVHFFWADERCVPPTDEESNFKMADELLFQPLGIEPGKIHRIPGEQSPEKAAELAAVEIRRVVPVDKAGQPLLDVIFLGMGEDGHVASLFPGEPEVMRANPAIFRAVKNSPKPPPSRVTLGYAAIAAARQVWVLVSGSGKEAAFRDALSPSGTTPLSRILHSRLNSKVFSNIR